MYILAGNEVTSCFWSAINCCNVRIFLSFQSRYFSINAQPISKTVIALERTRIQVFRFVFCEFNMLSVYLSKVVTSMVIRPLDDSRFCACSVFTHFTTRLDIFVDRQLFGCNLKRRLFDPRFGVRKDVGSGMAQPIARPFGVPISFPMIYMVYLLPRF